MAKILYIGNEISESVLIPGLPGLRTCNGAFPNAESLNIDSPKAESPYKESRKAEL